MAGDALGAVDIAVAVCGLDREGGVRLAAGEQHQCRRILTALAQQIRDRRAGLLNADMDNLDRILDRRKIAENAPHFGAFGAEFSAAIGRKSGGQQKQDIAWHKRGLLYSPALSLRHDVTDRQSGLNCFP